MQIKNNKNKNKMQITSLKTIKNSIKKGKKRVIENNCELSLSIFFYYTFEIINAS